MRSVSLTTRPPRSRERNGRDYFFITHKEFRRLRAAKKILEWTRYLGYYYATSRDAVERAFAMGRHVILCLDYRGVQQVRRAYAGDAVSIFILPPSIQDLERRIRSRCRSTRESEVARRIASARSELAHAADYDHRITNRYLPDALSQFRDVIQSEVRARKERKSCRTCRTCL